MGMSLEEYAAQQSDQDKTEAAKYAVPAFDSKKWAFFRDKLLSQIEILEDAQECTEDIEAIRILSKDILCLAKKINEIDNGYIRSAG